MGRMGQIVLYCGGLGFLTVFVVVVECVGFYVLVNVFGRCCFFGLFFGVNGVWELLCVALGFVGFCILGCLGWLLLAVVLVCCVVLYLVVL